jgi:hypothetical protein
VRWKPEFLRSSGSGTGSTQPREDNWEATWKGSSGSGLETEINGRGDSLRWPRNTLYSLKLALTSPTSCGRSVGVVRWRAKAPEFIFSFKWFLLTRLGFFRVVGGGDGTPDMEGSWKYPEEAVADWIMCEPAASWLGGDRGSNSLWYVTKCYTELRIWSDVRWDDQRLRIGTSGGLLWTSRFHKRWRMYWLAEQLLSYQGLYSIVMIDIYIAIRNENNTPLDLRLWQRWLWSVLSCGIYHNFYWTTRHCKIVLSRIMHSSIPNLLYPQ